MKLRIRVKRIFIVCGKHRISLVESKSPVYLLWLGRCLCVIGVEENNNSSRSKKPRTTTLKLHALQTETDGF